MLTWVAGDLGGGTCDGCPVGFSCAPNARCAEAIRVSISVTCPECDVESEAESVVEWEVQDEGDETEFRDTDLDCRVTGAICGACDAEDDSPGSRHAATQHRKGKQHSK